MGDYILLLISCVFVNNILLIHYLGNCSFLGGAKCMHTAARMAMGIMFVIVLAGAATWFIEFYLLKPFDLEHLRTIAFILVIAILVQFVAIFLKKSIPSYYTGLGIYLPLVTANCAVLGICISFKEELSFIQTLISSLSYAAGFAVSLVLFVSIRERILLARVPRPLKG